jgi:hypothetical protein
MKTNDFKEAVLFMEWYTRIGGILPLDLDGIYEKFKGYS